MENIFLRLRNEACWLIEELRRIPHVTLYSKGGEWQGPVVSFNIEGLLPSDVGYILQNMIGYGIGHPVNKLSFK